MALARSVATYDASGSENDPGGTLVVVGLAAREAKWDKFEHRWGSVLEEFGVPYLHMKELNHRRSGTGVYAKWKNDNHTPRRFLRGLVKTMKLSINKTFCYATILDDYQAVNRIYKLREGSGAPYVITAGACIDQVNRWMKRKYPNHPILHVLEKGDVGQRDLERLATKPNQPIITLPKLNPATGMPWAQFQAADLVAGAWRDAAGKRGRVRTFEDYGEVFNEIIRILPQRSLVYHVDNLRAACEAEPEKFPKR